MGAMARQQRRLLGVGGSRISLAGVVATTYAGNAISVGLPLAGPAAATVFAMRRFVVPRRGGVRRRVGAGRLRGVLVVRAGRRGGARGGGVRLRARPWSPLPSACSAAPCRWRSCCCHCAARDRGGSLERLGTRLVADVQKVSGHPHGDPEEIVQEQLEEVTALEPDPPTLWLAALLAALNWLADAACLAFAILAVGGDVPWEGLLLAWAAGTAVASLGLTPGGLGVVEAALSSALIATGLVGSTAIAAVLVYRIVSLWLVLAAGGLTLLGLGRAEARLSGRDRRPGRPGAAPAEGPRVSGGPRAAWPPRAGARCRRAAAGPACP